MNSNSKAANASLNVMNQGLANVAAGTRTSEDALNQVVHSVYSDSTGHVPTAAPRGQQGSFSVNSGHSWGGK